MVDANLPEPFFPPSMDQPPELDRRRATPPPTPRTALLISPFYRKDPYGSYAKHVLTPSLALTSVAAATPPDWSVRLWDENLLQGPPPADPFPALVGITVHLTFARRAYELAAWYRKRGAQVVLGGPHLLACADEAAAHADAIAVGEGVQLWPRILRDAERGALRPRYDGDFRAPFGGEPAPARELLPRRDYLTVASLTATRGCHNRCGFCHLSTRGLQMPYQRREPAAVAAEIATLDEPYAVFVDNNLGSDFDYLRALCRELRPLKRIWSAAVTLDVAQQPGLVGEMARAGCNGVFIGLETLEAANLDEAGKRCPRPAEYARGVEVFHRHRIQVNGSFVFGFDHDGPEVFEQTVAWIERTRLACATFHLLTPYPGTPLFRRMEAEGRLLHRDWERYDTAHAVFRPRRMTPAQLEAGYRRAYRRLFSHRSILRRRPVRTGDVPSYLVGSYLYKHANRVWPHAIRHRWTRALWRPLIHGARLRQQGVVRELDRDAGAAVATPAEPGSCPRLAAA
ncbi:MAG: radical SAM protein [Myxococcota bacterium]|jgi:radical SAM superfamily enzyme YgiQ (UPF0313 family)|nr:radical SAM protein [Myxococcota bacterium]